MVVVAGVEGFTCTRTTRHLTQEHLRRRLDSSDIQKAPETAYSKDREGSTVWKREPDHGIYMHLNNESTI